MRVSKMTLPTRAKGQKQQEPDKAITDLMTLTAGSDHVLRQDEAAAHGMESHVTAAIVDIIVYMVAFEPARGRLITGLFWAPQLVNGYTKGRNPYSAT